MAIDQGFIDEYKNLLIIQYWDKPKASSTVGAISSVASKIYDWFNRFDDEFDLGQAYGDRLDIIGKIVGMPRVIPFAIAKRYFGFSDNPDSYGFASKFDDAYLGGPLKSKFEIPYTDTELNDADYLFFIKAKIAKNVVAAFMTSDERVSIQDVVFTLFNSNAWIVDNYDMTMTLYISPAIDSDKVTIINQSDLLPKPQGVGYKIIVQADPLNTFGFSNNPNSKGFASKFDPAYTGGYLARKVI